MSIPVICDRCRATGISGEADFSHLGDLLEFTPVPRRPRVNGWDPEAQRAFIAALSVTGSKRQAALSIGRNAFGIDQLLKADDNASFKAAYERAMAIARQNGTMKIARGVADAAARNAQLTPPSRLRGLDPTGGEADDGMSEDRKLELLESLANKFMKKVAAEREARLSGQVVAADFYLRQVTVLEVMFELMATGGEDGAGGMADAFEALQTARIGRAGVFQIVDTPFTRALDDRRREYWQANGEPPRPIAFAAEFSIDRGTHRTAIDQHTLGASSPPARGHTAEQWAAMGFEEQRAAREAQFREDAEAQVAHEQAARQEFEHSPLPSSRA
jgi:hypothetical protein